MSPQHQSRFRRSVKAKTSPPRAYLRVEELEDRNVLSPLALQPLVQVSGASPFGTTDPFDAGQGGTVYPNSEVEPQIAADPTNANNLVAVWQQDRWSGAGARGLGIGVSLNGGLTWTNSIVPKIDLPSGGTSALGTDLKRATDPWVSIGPDGTVYVSSLSLTTAGGSGSRPVDTAVVSITARINLASPTKLNWNDPVVVQRNNTATVAFDQANDKESVTADPLHPGTAYMVWDQFDFPGGDASFFAGHTLAFRGDGLFSRTTDGGATWDAARPIFDPLANEFTIGHQIVVMPAGSAHPGRLVDTFELGQGSGKQPVQAGSQSIAVMISDDRGLTWTAPIEVGTAFFLPISDPDTGGPVRVGEPIPDVAVDPGNGNLYVTWLDSRFNNFQHDDVLLSSSTDGGQTWSVPIKVNQTPATGPDGNQQAFIPSVAVASNHTVAVTYYDFRNNTSAAGVPTDYWIAHADGGTDPTNPANWAANGDQRLTNASFNMEEAAQSRGFFVGDYEGLVTTGNKFLALFVQAGLEAGNPGSNVFFRDPPPADSAPQSLSTPVLGNKPASFADYALFAGVFSDQDASSQLTTDQLATSRKADSAGAPAADLPTSAPVLNGLLLSDVGALTDGEPDGAASALDPTLPLLERGQ
jgi:hypothetical protein